MKKDKNIVEISINKNLFPFKDFHLPIKPFLDLTGSHLELIAEFNRRAGLSPVIQGPAENCHMFAIFKHSEGVFNETLDGHHKKMSSFLLKLRNRRFAWNILTFLRLDKIIQKLRNRTI